MTWAVLAAAAVGLALTAVAVAFATARRLHAVDERLTQATDLLALRIKQISSPPAVAPLPPPAPPSTGGARAPEPSADPPPPPPAVDHGGFPEVDEPTLRPARFGRPRDAYAHWCVSGNPPAGPVGHEIVALRYVGARSPTELAAPRHEFEDVQGSGELVRITVPGAADTLVWPHPASVFDGYTHPLLFPGLTAEILSDPDARSRVAPARLVLAEGRWSTVPG